MREILSALVTVAGALAVVAAVVFGAHDTALFVPPPEAVAEEFGRELALGRYDLAARQLAGAERRRVTASELRDRFAPAAQIIGKLNRSEATERSRDDAYATAACELRGEWSAIALTVRMVREQGLWRVERWEAAAATVR